MPKRELLIGLDVPTVSEARQVVEETHDVVDGYKVGFQLIYTMLRLMLKAASEKEAIANLKDARALFQYLNGKLFLDAKLHDISNTVLQALIQIFGMDVALVNMHCLGGRKMLLKAQEALKQVFADFEPEKRPNVLGVTILTDHDYDSLVELGLVPALNPPDPNSPQSVLETFERMKTSAMQGQVRKLAILAKDCGLDGVVASPLETVMIREACGPDFLIANPAIRPLWSLVPGDDQKRFTTPKQAVENGANLVIVARPALKPPAGISRHEAVVRIKEEMALV
ncbi:MAG: orotidine-5'-phosphate decarboxylase [Candidatus Buchananbacteria bacterium]